MGSLITFGFLIGCIAFTAASQAQDITKDLTPYFTSTMDGLFDWYEQGLNTAAPTSGLPPAGIVHGSSDRNSTFLMQPYNQNNVLLLGDGLTTSGTFTLTTPTLAKSISLLVSTGNGPGALATTIHFSDGTPDVTIRVDAEDWFGISDHNDPGIAGIAGNGRIQVVTGMEFTTGSVAGTFQAAGAGIPNIVQENVPLSLSAAHLVSSIDFTWIKEYNNIYPSHTAIFALSTSPTGSSPYAAAPLTPGSFTQDVVIEAAALPEPGSAGILLVIAPLTLLRFRPRA